MKLPEITALQFVTLSLLFSGEKTARELRRQLQKWGGPRTSAAFSQLVGRLQRAAYVDAVRENRVGRRFSQSRYRLTDLGLIVWKVTQRFYGSFDAPPANFKPVATDEAEFADRLPTQRPGLVKQKYTDALLAAFRRKVDVR